MASTFMWLAVYITAMAMASSVRSTMPSTRWRTRLVVSWYFSAPLMISSMACTALTGCLPTALSAESITASVPSSTALATSETSARVGTGAWIIDSIICVAVITTLLRVRLVDDGLLQTGDGRVTHLHREIAARHHEHVRGFDDLHEVLDGFVAFDLGADVPVTPGKPQQRARQVHVSRIARERNGNVVGAFR